MKYFFSRLDKSDSSSPPESPEINTEDILRSPSRKLEEGRKLDTLSVENKNKFKDMKDEIEAGMEARKDEFEAGMEARKKNLEEWFRRGETTDKKRMTVSREVTKEMIEKIVHDNLTHLEEIILSGNNRRQQDFHRSDASRTALIQSDLSAFVTGEQITIILEELNKLWRNKMEKSYAERVLLPEVIITIYCDLFGISREETEQELLNCVFGPSPTKTR